MKAHRTANLRVHTTPAKFAALFQMASACRFVWNWAVRTNRAELWAWQHSAAQAWLGTRPKPSVTFFTWSKRSTRLRKNTPWLADLPYAPLRATLRRWSQSWAAYFDPKVPQDGKPKFHDRDHKLWVDFPGSSATLKGRWLRLGGIGWVRLSGSDQYAGAKVVSVHLSCEDGRKWFATIGYEVELPKPADNGLAIGVDMNCGQVATSTGYILRAPDVTRLEARRKRYQRRMARCKKGSKRREIMRQRMAKAIRRKRNIGRDWRHQVSRRLADTAGMVVIEDLQVAKMTRSAKGSLDAPGKRRCQGGNEQDDPCHGMGRTAAQRRVQGGAHRRRRSPQHEQEVPRVRACRQREQNHASGLQVLGLRTRRERRRERGVECHGPWDRGIWAATGVRIGDRGDPSTEQQGDGRLAGSSCM